MTTRPHLIDGEFQSDKYPTTPRGKVPLSTKDPTAQDLLWEYAQRRRTVDADFADDLEAALRSAGYEPAATKEVWFVAWADGTLSYFAGEQKPSEEGLCGGSHLVRFVRRS